MNYVVKFTLMTGEYQEGQEAKVQETLDLDTILHMEMKKEKARKNTEDDIHKVNGAIHELGPPETRSPRACS